MMMMMNSLSVLHKILCCKPLKCDVNPDAGSNIGATTTAPVLSYRWAKVKEEGTLVITDLFIRIKAYGYTLMLFLSYFKGKHLLRHPICFPRQQSSSEIKTSLKRNNLLVEQIISFKS